LFEYLLTIVKGFGSTFFDVGINFLSFPVVVS